MSNSALNRKVAKEAFQQINDLMLEKALVEGSMAKFMLSEGFSSADFTRLVKAIASTAQGLPKGMSQTRSAMGQAIKTAKKAKIALNKGKLKSERFARITARIASLASAVASAIEEIRDVAALKSVAQQLTAGEEKSGALLDADGMLAEEGKTLNDYITDPDDREMLKSSINQHFKPEGILATLFGKKKSFFGLTSDGLYNDILNLGLDDVQMLMKGDVPESLSQALSDESEAEVAQELGVTPEDPDEEPENSDKAASGLDLTRDEAVGILNALGVQASDETINKFKTALSSYKITVESKHRDEDRVVLERWRRMAGIKGGKG